MIICDTHCDTLYSRAVHPGKKTDITVPRLKKAGISLQTMAMFVGGRNDTESKRAAYKKMLAEAEKLKEEGLKQVFSPDEATGTESAFMLSVEGCDLLDEEPSLIGEWREKGVRMAALTWNWENRIGTPACIDQEAPLKPDGKSIVKELLAAGIACDISHLSRRGVWDLLEMGVVPLASHSCCDALHACPRNLTDEQLRALFSAGGYVGVNFYPAFLTQGKAQISDVVQHLLHMLEMGGEGRIGFGSDFDGIECKPKGLASPLGVKKLIEALRGEGLSEEQVCGIAGENLIAYYRRAGL